MKKLFSILSIALFVVALMSMPAMAKGGHQGINPDKPGHGYDNGPGYGPGNGNGYGHNGYNGCGGKKCKEKMSFSGDVEQSDGAFMTDGWVIEDDGEYTVKNGALASGGNTSSGSYEGTTDEWGIGGAVTVGATLLYVDHDYNSNIAAGITGNLSAAGFGGEDVKGMAEIEGSGELTTISQTKSNCFFSDDIAQAYSTGSFEYAGKICNDGVVVGGGLTGGFSYTALGYHTATAAAGQISVSGVGQIDLGR